MSETTEPDNTKTDETAGDPPHHTRKRPSIDAAVAVSAALLHDLVEAAHRYAKDDERLAAALAPFES